MRSHFTLGRSAALACAVAGAAALAPGECSAQVAADYATNPTYSGGWSTGQNGGFGFGAWSFNQTQDQNNNFVTSGQQGMSSSSALATAWTMFNLSSSAGLANAGRSISLGLGVGETFETFIQNPTTTAGYYTYRGFDILFTSGPDNNPPGNNTSAIRLQVFDYYNSNQHWALNDATHTSHALATSITGPTTGAKGVKIDLQLTSLTTYALTMTPLNGATPYSITGNYSGPISYVDFRLYNTLSGGLNDTANNFEISSMTIVPEPSSVALFGLCSAGLLFIRRRR